MTKVNCYLCVKEEHIITEYRSKNSANSIHVDNSIVSNQSHSYQECGMWSMTRGAHPLSVDFPKQ